MRRIALLIASAAINASTIPTLAAETASSKDVDASPARSARGQPPDRLAAFLDRNGYLPTGVPMLKRVLALPGQTVCRHGLTIAVDGIDVGRAQERDGRGRPLPVWDGCRTIADGDVFVMNWQSSDSLDGRYFGPLPVSAVIGRAQPMWTDEE
jgi:conjugative transfer signal peptidase TraF